jgi:hypothetical protein
MCFQDFPGYAHLVRPVIVASHGLVTSLAGGSLSTRFEASQCKILVHAHGHAPRDEHSSHQESATLGWDRGGCQGQRARSHARLAAARTCDRAILQMSALSEDRG